MLRIADTESVTENFTAGLWHPAPFLVPGALYMSPQSLLLSPAHAQQFAVRCIAGATALTWHHTGESQAAHSHCISGLYFSSLQIYRGA